MFSLRLSRRPLSTVTAWTYPLRGLHDTTCNRAVDLIKRRVAPTGVCVCAGGGGGGVRGEVGGCRGDGRRRNELDLTRKTAPFLVTSISSGPCRASRGSSSTASQRGAGRAKPSRPSLTSTWVGWAAEGPRTHIHRRGYVILPAPPEANLAGRLAEEPGLKERVHFFKFDVDELPQVAQQLGVRAMPTFVFFKDGDKQGEVIGADPKALAAAVRKLAED